MIEVLIAAFIGSLVGSFVAWFHGLTWRRNEEVEQLQVQLAGCLVAAEGYAHGECDCVQGDYGWSPAFQAVKVLRIDCDGLKSALRSELEKVHGP